MTPTEANLTLVRGNSWRPRFLFTDADLSGAPFGLVASDELIMTLTSGATTIRRTLSEGEMALFAPNGVDVAFTVEETRALPSGMLTQWELELRRDGAEETVARGMITATGGINNDDDPATALADLLALPPTDTVTIPVPGDAFPAAAMSSLRFDLPPNSGYLALF